MCLTNHSSAFLLHDVRVVKNIACLSSLLPNLYDKEKYVVHHEALKCYLKYGMKLKKIHAGISYEERDYMKEFIDINAEARKVAKQTHEQQRFRKNHGKREEQIED